MKKILTISLIILGASHAAQSLSFKIALPFGRQAIHQHDFQNLMEIYQIQVSMSDTGNDIGGESFKVMEWFLPKGLIRLLNKPE